jgi:hypothetical protein
VVVSWLLHFLIWMLPDALIAAIDSRRRPTFNPSQFGEARFDSKTGKQIK